jgi:mono/diheme cytochrome c family protein
MLAAATTQRAIGWVFFGLAIAGFVIYIVINVRSGRKEISSEIELAANRKPYYGDDELESKKLERSLLFALGMLGLIAVGLPFYWLREPARQDNADNGFEQRSTSRGATEFAGRCEQCHGPGGVGGARSVTLTDPNGDYFATVNWKAPALTTVLSRFEESEVLQVLNYGRNGVMPAFGAPGGGPLTTQQLDDIIHYLRSIQLPEDQIRKQVDDGVRAGARDVVLADGTDLKKRQDALADITDATQRAAAKKSLDAEIDAAVDAYLKQITDPSSPRFKEYGKLLFNDTAAQGAYSCARCHTPGWSYNAASPDVKDRDGNPIMTEYLDGAGWMAPELRGGVTVRKFPTVKQHETFVAQGSADGFPYLPDVPSMGSGQMPGFGPRTDDKLKVTYPGILTDDQIAAIVAYERSL